MTVKQLRILNVLIYFTYIISTFVIVPIENPDFYGKLILVCLLFGITDVYLQELNDEKR